MVKNSSENGWWLYWWPSGDPITKGKTFASDFRVYSEHQKKLGEIIVDYFQKEKNYGVSSWDHYCAIHVNGVNQIGGLILTIITTQHQIPTENNQVLIPTSKLFWYWPIGLIMTSAGKCCDLWLPVMSEYGSTYTMPSVLKQWVWIGDVNPSSSSSAWPSCLLSWALDLPHAHNAPVKTGSCF